METDSTPEAPAPPPPPPLPLVVPIRPPAESSPPPGARTYDEDDDDLGRALLGGKASSLLRLVRGGFDVPRGAVLTSRLFDPWVRSVVETEEWERVRAHLLGSDDDDDDDDDGGGGGSRRLEVLCESLRAAAVPMIPPEPLDEAIDRSLTDLGRGSSRRYAVRSSSPEEDLGAASFAGLYETVLDVGGDADEVADAVRTCALSCLSARVLRYKAEMGLPLEPSAAVIVQRMVDADSSGVAFSVSPATNDYDEVLINAGWGLGESVVGGEVSPDVVVADKLTKKVVEYRTGDKGGDRPGERCLSEGRASELCEAVCKVEAMYGGQGPVDVEWAFEGGKLWLLQARPVTAYVPLHPDQLTAPGERRHLYMDNYLRKGMTTSEAVSPMSDDVMTTLFKLCFGWLLALPPEDMDLPSGGVHLHSRSHVDMSNVLHLMSAKKISKLSDSTDVMIGKILSSPLIERYRLERPPPHLTKWSILRRLPGVLWRARRLVAPLLAARYRPDRFLSRFRRLTEEFDRHITRPMDYSRPARECLEGEMRVLGSFTVGSSYPALAVFMMSSSGMKGLIDDGSPEQRSLLDSILGGHEGDMVVEMGAALSDLSKLLPPGDFDDVRGLARRLERRDPDMPDAFLRGWDGFVERYGCRGPLEMEVANRKYGEDPAIALGQMATLARAAAASGGDDRGAESSFDPREMQGRRIKKREEAYQQLLGLLPARRAGRLRTYYGLYHRYAAHREVPKHQILQVFWRLRCLLLRRGDEFVDAGRLDERDQVFMLHMDDVDRAAADPGVDLRSLVADRSAFYRKLRRHVRHFPLFIDSRGRIVRLPPTYEDGALVGTAVSAGRARGRVVVLNHPSEKEVRRGDVIVAVATDPGWTPLFACASAVVLEVGGELQHGALIAREYGKPCVSGVQDVTAQFHDGQVVEVDGDSGVVRFID